MVSDADRAHFRLIAEVEAELNLESIHAAARRAPGVNIEIGLALSEIATELCGDLARPEEVSLASVWRARAPAKPPPP